MSKFFLYNGVKLPALPEWDTAVYPYAFIWAVGTIVDEVVSEHCTLVISASNQMVYDRIGIGFRYGDVGIGKTTSEGDSEWVDWAQNSNGAEYFYVKRNEPTEALYIRVVWANFDVLSADGSVYVAASEPVAVAEKFPLRGWLGWLLAGLCSRPLPMGAREPVAWLYNGVRLPGLPEWDRGKYPYAVIYKAPAYTGEDGNTVYEYGLICSSSLWVYNWYYDSSGAPSLRSYCGSPYSAWGDFGNNLDADFNHTVVWANTDILYSSGAVKITASDPVPVYE